MFKVQHEANTLLRVSEMATIYLKDFKDQFQLQAYGITGGKTEINTSSIT